MILSLIIPLLMLALAHRWTREQAAISSRPPPPCAPSHVRKVPR